MTEVFTNFLTSFSYLGWLENQFSLDDLQLEDGLNNIDNLNEDVMKVENGEVEVIDITGDSEADQQEPKNSQPKNTFNPIKESREKVKGWYSVVKLKIAQAMSCFVFEKNITKIR